MKLDKVFVAVDFKETTISLVSHAIWLSKLTNCNKLCLFHVLEYNLTPPAYLMPYIEKEKRKIENELTQLADKIKDKALNVSFIVKFGRLIDSINSIINREDAFLVLGFKSHITRPSTSERILKGVRVPVFIVKELNFNEISPERIKLSRILCPIDFSENSLRALSTAKEIALASGAVLSAIHVVPEQRVRAIVEDSSAFNNYLDLLREESLERLNEIAKGHEIAVLVGNPAEEILRKVREYDLIVIGSKGRSYASAILIGSVAEAVIKNSPKNVLLIP